MSSTGNKGVNSVKKCVKNKTWNIFTLVYNSENHQAFTHDIMTKLNMSRQAIHYHINILLNLGFIEKIRDIQNIYKALKSPYETEVVKKLLMGTEPSHISSHAIGYSFKIIKEGIPIKLKTSIKLRNWISQQGKINGCTIRKTTKNIQIWSPTIKGISARDNETKANMIVLNVAQELANRFDLKLGSPKLIRRPDHEVITPAIKKTAKKVLKETGNIITEYGSIDGSREEGNPGMEYHDYMDADDVLSLGHNMRTINERLMKLETVIEKSVKVQLSHEKQMFIYAKHLNAHIPVLLELAPALRNFKIIAKKMKRQIDILNQKSLKDFIKGKHE